MQNYFRDRVASMNYYYRYYPIDYFFEALKKNSISNFELWTCTHHIDIEEVGVMELRNLKKKMHLNELNGVCLTPEQSNPKPYNVATRDPQLVKKTQRYLQRVVDVAGSLEIPLISLNSGWDYYNESPYEAWMRSVEMIDKIADYARGKGIKIVFEALQPDESHLVNTINDLVLYLKELHNDNVYVNIDFGAMARSNETIEQYFTTFGDRIIHCHFVDGNPTGHLAWGDGDRNVTVDLAKMKEKNYDGFFTFEFANSKYFQQPEETDRRAIRFIEQSIFEMTR